MLCLQKQRQGKRFRACLLTEQKRPDAAARYTCLSLFGFPSPFCPHEQELMCCTQLPHFHLPHHSWLVVSPSLGEGKLRIKVKNRALAASLPPARDREQVTPWLGQTEQPSHQALPLKGHRALPEFITPSEPVCVSCSQHTQVTAHQHPVPVQHGLGCGGCFFRAEEVGVPLQPAKVEQTGHLSSVCETEKKLYLVDHRMPMPGFLRIFH